MDVSRVTRREMLQMAAMAALAGGFAFGVRDVRAATERLRTSSARVPEFFTEHEFETVEILVDLILPADERSGSASAAGVPGFMDFMMIDRPEMQTPMRGGLAWIDRECFERFGRVFVDASDTERRAVLDDIAYPEHVPDELSHGVAFFNSFRDLTASGFWSSRMGVDDLQYEGNVFVPEWTGCPPEALDRLGVSYD